MEKALPADTPLFHQPWWLDATGLPWEMAEVQKGERISGIWPYFPQKKWGASLLSNPPLIPYLGPHVFFPADLKSSKRESFEHQTIAALLETLPSFQVVSTALRPGLKQLDLFAQKGFGIKVRQTFLMDLKDITEAELQSRLHEDYRRNLRKASEEITITAAPEEIENLYLFQEATLAGKGLRIHYSLPYLKKLFNAAIAHNQGTLWAARKKGVLQALVWHLWDERRSYYLIGAKNPETKDARALTALIFHAMNQSRIWGKESFDFEGSMDPGVAHFFRNFGGRKELYLVLEKTDSMLWKIKNQIR